MPMFWLNRALGYLAEPPISHRFLAMTAMAISAMGALATRSKWAVPVVMLAVLEVAWGQMNPYPWPLSAREASALSVMRG